MAIKIGLSGGIGSGKSTVLQLFKDKDVPTYSADMIARELSLPGSTEFQQIVEYFSPNILDSQGLIDRTKLGENIFADTGKRKRLETILHPGIRKILLTWADQCPANFCILEIPLLFESSLYQQMDHTIAVVCDKATRIDRVANSRNKSPEFIQKVIDTQISDQTRSQLAHSILDNNRSLHHLKQQIEQLFKQLNQLYALI